MIQEFIERDFGSYNNFLEEFKQAATTQFGSGWVWLVVKDNKLAVEKSTNAVNPLIWGHIPLLTIDVGSMLITSTIRIGGQTMYQHSWIT